MGGAGFTALLGWVLGVALQLAQVELWPRGLYVVLMTAAGVLFAVSFGLMRRGGRGMVSAVVPVVPLVLVAALMAGFSQVGWRASLMQDRALPAVLEGVDLLVTGVVDGLPQETDGDQRFSFQVEQVLRLEGGRQQALPAEQAQAFPDRLQLTWYGRAFASTVAGAAESSASAPSDSTGEPDDLDRDAPAQPTSMPLPSVSVGDRWQLPVRLRAPHGSANPHAFDYELWLWERGVQALGYVRIHPRLPPAQRLASTWQAPLEQLREAVRQRIVSQLEGQPQSQRLSGILSALVMGDQGAIDSDDWAVFRDTGIAHLVAISGLHITMFCWLAVRFVGAAWRRSPRLLALLPAPLAALAVGVALSTFYAAFSGWGVPAQRTIWMLAMVAVLRMAGLRWPQPMVWLTAMAVVLAVDPWALLQAGFWLSFVAVGVLFASGDQRTNEAGFAKGPIEARATAGVAEDVGSNASLAPADRLSGLSTGLARLGGGLRKALVTMLREQGLVTVSLMPLTLLLFQQMSVVGVLVNLVAIPLVTFVVLPLAMFGVMVHALWQVDAWLLMYLMDALEWCAALPGATWVSPARPMTLAVVAAAAGALAVLRLPWRWRLLALPWVLPFLLWQWPTPATGEFSLTALDVGQGQAVLVQTAQHALLYDAGPLYARRGDRQVDAGERVIVPYLHARGVVLDRLFLSHTDTDHTGGAHAVLSDQAQAEWMGSIPADHPLHRLRPGQPCTAGMRWRWDDVEFRVLWPEVSDEAAMRAQPNSQSCVLMVSNAHESVLLPGDIGAAQERAMLANWPAGPADGSGSVSTISGWMMPHHGSRSSSAEATLRTLQPRWAVAQAGYRNRFGHPNSQIVERYRRLDIRVFDSAHCGAWTWSSAQPQDFGCHRVDAAHYWTHRP